MSLPAWEEWNAALIGAGCIGMHNYMKGMPVFARLPLMGVFGAGGYLIGTQLAALRFRRRAEHDLYILDYVKQHPEDFPEIRSRKYGEVFEPWHPVR